MSFAQGTKYVVTRSALVFLGLLCALGLAELVLRALSPLQLGFEYQDERFSPPRESGIYTDVNEFGSHDISPPPRTPGVARVLLLGDSFVQGLAVPVEQTVARRLARYLSENKPDSFDVVSLAYGGGGPRG